MSRLEDVEFAIKEKLYLPTGFSSKKAMGALRRMANMELWRFLDEKVAIKKNMNDLNAPSKSIPMTNPI